MKNLINKLTIKQKIFSSLLIPILALVVLSIFNISEKKDSIRKLEYFQVHYEYYEKISYLIHNIESERKLAFFYIGSEGKKYKNELNYQREKIDEGFANLKKFLNNHKSIFDRKLITLISDNIDHLELFRVDVDNLKVFLDIEQNFYTDLVYNLLYSASNIPAMTNHKYLSNQTLAYKYLIESKEYLSLKVGLLNYVIASKKLTIKDINRLRFFDEFYKNNLTMFKYFVSKRIKEEFLNKKIYKYSSSQKLHNKLAKQKLVKKSINKVRNISALEVDISKVDLEKVANAIVNKTNFLKKIEDKLASDIIFTIKKEKETLYNRLNIYIFIITFIVLLVFTIGILISRNIIEKIIYLQKGLVGFLKYVKKEEKKFKPLILEGEDEINYMVNIVNESIKETAVFIEHEVKSAKKLQAQMMESEKLAQMGEMIGNIAHQWRQPLSMISTVASGISVKKSFQQEVSDEEIIKDMEKIDEYSQYLSQTIDTFRNFIKEKKEKKSQTIQENIQKAKSILQGVLSDVSIELIDNTDYENLVYVNIVSGELPQVLINLLANAKDIILEKDIKEAWIKIDMYTKDDSLFITVEDNAGGVPEDIKRKIFDPYFTTKHQSQGTGLGLHMSYRIVSESLHGKIYVENTKNGAKFFVEMPIYNI